MNNNSSKGVLQMSSKPTTSSKFTDDSIAFSPPPENFFDRYPDLKASSLFGVGSIGGEVMLSRRLPCAAGFRGCGKVGILVLDFHFSTALSFLFSGFLCVTEQPPELWKWGNLAAFARFPRNCGSSGKPAVGFPLDP